MSLSEDNNRLSLLNCKISYARNVSIRSINKCYFQSIIPGFSYFINRSLRPVNKLHQ